MFFTGKQGAQGARPEVCANVMKQTIETVVRLARLGKAHAPTRRGCYEKTYETAVRLARLVFLNRILV